MLRDKILAVVAVALLAVGYCHDATAEGLPKGGLLPIGAVAKAGSSTWTGFYVGGHAGYGVAVGEINIGDAFLRGLSADGALYGLHAGFDYQLPNSIFVLGVRGGYTWSDMAFEAGVSGEGSLALQLRDGWWVDGVVGLGLGAVKPYVFAGYTQIGTGASLTGFGSTSGPDLDGVRLGTGIEWKLPGAPFVSLALDYTYTRYDSIDLCGGCGELSIDPEDHRVLAKLNFRFGGK